MRLAQAFRGGETEMEGGGESGPRWVSSCSSPRMASQEARPSRSTDAVNQDKEGSKRRARGYEKGTAGQNAGREETSEGGKGELAVFEDRNVNAVEATSCGRGVRASSRARSLILLLSCLAFLAIQDFVAPSVLQLASERKADLFTNQIALAAAHATSPVRSSTSSHSSSASSSRSSSSSPRSASRAPQSSASASLHSSESSSHSSTRSSPSSARRSSSDPLPSQNSSSSAPHSSPSPNARKRASASRSSRASSRSAVPGSSETTSAEEVNGLRGRARVWKRRTGVGLSSRLREFLADSSTAHETEAQADASEELVARARLLGQYARSRRQLLEDLEGKTAGKEGRGSARIDANGKIAKARSAGGARQLNALTYREKKALKSALLAAQLSRLHMQSIQSERSRYGLVRPLLDDSDAAGVYTANECVAVRYADYPKEFPGYDTATASCKCPDGWLPCAKADATAHMSAWEPVIWEENADEGCTKERGEVMLEHMNFYSCPQKSFVDYTGPADAKIRDQQCKRVAFVLCRAAASSCITGPWSDWTSCSVPCGEGYQYRWRIPISGPMTSPTGGATTQSSRAACAPYHMEERRKCNLGPCPPSVTSTTCFWTTVQLERTEGAFDEERGSCKCGTGDEKIDREEGAMVPCTPEEAIASMDNWKSFFRQYCYSSLGLKRRSTLALRFHSYGHAVRLGMRDLWHLDCTGGWSRFNVFEGKMFCGKGAKVLCRAATDHAQVPFSIEENDASTSDAAAAAKLSMLVLDRRRRALEASLSFSEGSAIPSEVALAHLWISLVAGAIAAVVLLVCLSKRAALMAFLRSSVAKARKDASTKGKNGQRFFFAVYVGRETVREGLRALGAFARRQWSALTTAVDTWMAAIAEKEAAQEMCRLSAVSGGSSEANAEKRQTTRVMLSEASGESRVASLVSSVSSALAFPARVPAWIASFMANSQGRLPTAAQRLWAKVRSTFLSDAKEKGDEDLASETNCAAGKRGIAYASSFASRAIERRRGVKMGFEGADAESETSTETREMTRIPSPPESVAETASDDSRLLLSAVEERLLFPRGKKKHPRETRSTQYGGPLGGSQCRDTRVLRFDVKSFLDALLVVQKFAE